MKIIGKILIAFLFYIPFYAHSGPIFLQHKVRLCLAHYNINNLETALIWCKAAEKYGDKNSSLIIGNINKWIRDGQTKVNMTNTKAVSEVCQAHISIDAGDTYWCHKAAAMGDEFSINIIKTVTGGVKKN